jgi:tRNA A37 threonylcarbamoyladenosine biosynthesis protein TsaE
MGELVVGVKRREVERHVGPEVTILHADMYRLIGPDDLHEIGWHDALSRATWAFVEWPERIADALPADRIDVTITIPHAVWETVRPRIDAIVSEFDLKSHVRG